MNVRGDFLAHGHNPIDAANILHSDLDKIHL